MIDELRENPLESIARFFPSPVQKSTAGLPVSVRILTWLFLPTKQARRRVFRSAALRLLRVK